MANLYAISDKEQTCDAVFVLVVPDQIEYVLAVWLNCKPTNSGVRK